MTDSNGCRLLSGLCVLNPRSCCQQKQSLKAHTRASTRTNTHTQKKHCLCGSWQCICLVLAICGQQPEQHSGCSSSGGPQALPDRLGFVLQPAGSGCNTKQRRHPSSSPLGGALINSAQQLHCRRGEEEPPPSTRPPLPCPFSPRGLSASRRGRSTKSALQVRSSSSVQVVKTRKKSNLPQGIMLAFALPLFLTMMLRQVRSLLAVLKANTSAN